MEAKQAFAFEEQSDTTCTVTAVYENRYGDLKVEVDTPAPWDVDDMRPANEAVKSLDWESHHPTFEDDKKVWSLDASGVTELRGTLEDWGYTWEGPESAEETRIVHREHGDVFPGEEERSDEQLERAAEHIEEGDRVRLVYEKANGNGTGSKEGEATAANADPSLTVGLVVRRDDGNFNKARLDDSGEPAVFHTGQYPYMGRLVRIEVL
jgi:hypothetical protein